MSDRNNWRRVTRAAPCPVCEKPDWCLVSRDGSAAICPRTEAGSVKRAGDAGWLHVLEDRPEGFRRPAPLSDPPPALRDFGDLARRMFANGTVQRTELAELLGVSLSSLERIEVGWNRLQECWTVPERDVTGKVIGLQRRFRDGTQKRWAGGRSALTYAPDWDTGSGPLFLVEGASDVAALLDAELTVIGRPSNLGGVALLADMLATFPSDREVIVVAERDRKPNGTWPGREGAVRTAEQLSERLERGIGWCLPPDEAKDARQWRNSLSGVHGQSLASLWFEQLDVVDVAPPPVLEPDRPDVASYVNLDEWRHRMIEQRHASLEEPGVWLDRSPTGAGKSHVDLEVILAQREVVA